MKLEKYLSLFAIILISLCASSCSAIMDIFQAGMGFGIFIVVAVIIVIVVMVFRIKNK